MKENIKKLKVNNRYKTFTFFDKAVCFKDYFKDKDYKTVQVHDMTPCGEDILGFSGVFSWKKNQLTSLDGDSYTSQMPVWGYHEFIHEGEKCLDILVEEW